MPSSLPVQTLRRVQLPTNTTCTHVRYASLLKRPHRPYAFTQLVTLSDGSTYLTRTTSPAPVVRSTKDVRNHVLWQPTLDTLRGIEQDEAGRLRAFRNKFGRGWDVEDGEGKEEDADQEKEESLMDLISSGTSPSAASTVPGPALGERRAKKGKDVKEVKMVTIKKDGVLVEVPLLKSSEKRS